MTRKQRLQRQDEAAASANVIIKSIRVFLKEAQHSAIAARDYRAEALIVAAGRVLPEAVVSDSLESSR